MNSDTTPKYPPRSGGLGGGGVVPVSAAPVSVRAVESSESKVLPPELLKDAQDLSSILQEEKELCSELCRVLDIGKEVRQVSEDMEEMREMVRGLHVDLKKARERVIGLKKEGSRDLFVNLAMAERTQEMPASMQASNSEPTEFFIDLISRFQRQSEDIGDKIKEVEMALEQQGEATIREDGKVLLQAVEGVHESLTSLAAEYHPVHCAVQKMKHDLLRKDSLSHPVTSKTLTVTVSIASPPPPPSISVKPCALLTTPSVVTSGDSIVPAGASAPPRHKRTQSVLPPSPPQTVALDLSQTVSQVDMGDVSLVAGFLGSAPITWDTEGGKQGGFKRGKTR